MTSEAASPDVRMPTEITLGLDGEVTIEDFNAAMRGLQTLVSDLTKELAPDAQIEWVISALSGGSASATLEAKPAEGDEQAAYEVADAYGRVGMALERNEELPVAAAVRGANLIRRVIGSRILSASFVGNGSGGVVRSTAGQKAGVLAHIESRGAVTGYLDTLEGHRGLKVVVYELTDGRAVKCHLSEEQTEEIRDLWKTAVTVEGLVRRDIATGRASSVSDVTAVIPHETTEPGAWRNLAGIAPRPEGAPSAEEAIRRARDE